MHRAEIKSLIKSMRLLPMHLRLILLHRVISSKPGVKYIIITVRFLIKNIVKSVKKTQDFIFFYKRLYREIDKCEIDFRKKINN